MASVIGITREKYVRIKTLNMTEEEEAAYKRELNRIRCKAYRSKNKDKCREQTLARYSKWYSKEENKVQKCIKNKYRWYCANIAKLESDLNNLTSKQLKRLNTLKQMRSELVNCHREIVPSEDNDTMQ